MPYIVVFKPSRGCPVPSYVERSETAEADVDEQWLGTSSRADAHRFTDAHNAELAARDLFWNRGYPDYSIVAVA